MIRETKFSSGETNPDRRGAYCGKPFVLSVLGGIDSNMR